MSPWAGQAIQWLRWVSGLLCSSASVSYLSVGALPLVPGNVINGGRRFGCLVGFTAPQAGLRGLLGRCLAFRGLPTGPPAGCWLPAVCPVPPPCTCCSLVSVRCCLPRRACCPLCCRSGWPFSFAPVGSFSPVLCPCGVSLASASPCLACPGPSPPVSAPWLAGHWQQSTPVGCLVTKLQMLELPCISKVEKCIK